MTRWVLLELLGELEGQIPDSPSLPSGLREMLRVLVEERNAQVHRDTLKWLETSPPPRSIAILYGVGHMPDLEKRLRQSPGVETGQELWFTAFDVDPMAAGLSATERAFTRALIQRQLEGLRAELNASSSDSDPVLP